MARRRAGRRAQVDLEQGRAQVDEEEQGGAVQVNEGRFSSWWRDFQMPQMLLISYISIDTNTPFFSWIEKF